MFYTDTIVIMLIINSITNLINNYIIIQLIVLTGGHDLHNMVLK